jgi:hypothetical protein
MPLSPILRLVPFAEAAKKKSTAVFISTLASRMGSSLMPAKQPVSAFRNSFSRLCNFPPIVHRTFASEKNYNEDQ